MSFFSRNLNENLIFGDENGNTFLWFSCFETRTGIFFLSNLCFETRTRNRKLFLKVEQEKIKLILTGIPGNGNSRHSLVSVAKCCRSDGYILVTKLVGWCKKCNRSFHWEVLLRENLKKKKYEIYFKVWFIVKYIHHDEAI